MFVRLSLVKPRAEVRAEAITLVDHVLTHFATLNGYVHGYRLESAEYVGRVTVWENRAAADDASNDTHTMAARSRLLELRLPTEEESLDLGFEGSVPAETP